MTNQQWVSLTAGSIVSLQQLGDNLVDPVREEVQQLAADVWGAGGILGSKVSMTYSSGRLTLAANFEAYNGDGDRVSGLTSETRWQSVPFKNTGGVTYHIGAPVADIPQDVAMGSDGRYYYTDVKEEVGRIGTPNSVTAPSGLLLNVNTLVDQGWGTGLTRPCVVWLLLPKTGATATAIYEGTIVENGGNYEITIPHLLGQATASLTAADYRVALLGPRITSTSLVADNSVFYIGTCITGTFSNAAQNVLAVLGTLSDDFYQEHKSGGEHSHINADYITVGPYGTDLEAIEIFSNSGDADGAEKILVRNQAGSAAMWVTAAGGIDCTSLDAGPTTIGPQGTDVTMLTVTASAGDANATKKILLRNQAGTDAAWMAANGDINAPRAVLTSTTSRSLVLPGKHADRVSAGTIYEGTTAPGVGYSDLDVTPRTLRFRFSLPEHAVITSWRLVGNHITDGSAELSGQLKYTTNADNDTGSNRGSAIVLTGTAGVTAASENITDYPQAGATGFWIDVTQTNSGTGYALVAKVIVYWYLAEA